MQIQRMPMASLIELLLLQLEKSGSTRLTVTGNSMQPMLCHGRDSVNLVPAGERQKRGQIILYRRDNGQYVLHRIVAVRPDGYLCCGDNQTQKETVRQDQLLAVVDGFTRKGKQIPETHPGYRFYKGLWLGCYPLRAGYVWMRKTAGRILRKLKLRK